jgi:hypothetical protein
VTEEQEALVKLLTDFAQLLTSDARVVAAAQNKAREIVGKIVETAYAEAVDAIDNAVNPSALI